MKLAWIVSTMWVGLLISAVSAREWTDRTGKYRIEANAVAVKNGKVYLEKADGNVTAVDLEKLGAKDLDFLKAKPEYRANFNAPAAEPGSGTASPETPAKKPMKAVPQDAEGKEGEVCRFGDLGWGVESLAFSPDGALLAAGKLDRAVMVFDIDRKARSAFYDKLEGLGQVTCVTFAPDGAKLLSGGWSGRIQIWDVGTGGTLAEGKRFVGHSVQSGPSPSPATVSWYSLAATKKRPAPGNSGAAGSCLPSTVSTARSRRLSSPRAASKDWPATARRSP